MITNLSQSRIKVSAKELEAFCSRWKILELSLFGSVIRDDFRPDSDVDVLVSFAEDAQRSFSGWMNMIDELEAIFGRKIDLVDRKLMDKPTSNPFRRRSILRGISHSQALALEDRDLAHLWDMQEACRMIQDMTSSLHLESFLKDEQILCATQFELERIEYGEIDPEHLWIAIQELIPESAFIQEILLRSRTSADLAGTATQ